MRRFRSCYITHTRAAIPIVAHIQSCFSALISRGYISSSFNLSLSCLSPVQIRSMSQYTFIECATKNTKDAPCNVSERSLPRERSNFLLRGELGNEQTALLMESNLTDEYERL